MNNACASSVYAYDQLLKDVFKMFHLINGNANRKSDIIILLFAYNDTKRMSK